MRKLAGNPEANGKLIEVDGSTASVTISLGRDDHRIVTFSDCEDDFRDWRSDGSGFFD
jgi:hypothetical protein